VDDQVRGEFDRTFKYDFAARLTSNSFGLNSNFVSPYGQSIQYDAFSQMTQRVAVHWDSSNMFTSSFVNGRLQTVAFQVPIYDAAGNLLNSGGSDEKYQRTDYDAANRPIENATRYREMSGMYSYRTIETQFEQEYDGEGHPLKITQTLISVPPSPPASVIVEQKYQVWSSVFRNVVTTLYASGAKRETKVFAGEMVIAKQSDNPLTAELVKWIHADPVTGSSEEVEKSGQSGGDYSRTELEPLGQEVLPVQPPQSGGIGESPYAASEPQWLCQYASKDFWKMPTSCQKQIFTRNDEALSKLLGVERETSLKKVAAPTAGRGLADARVRRSERKLFGFEISCQSPHKEIRPLR